MSCVALISGHSPRQGLHKCIFQPHPSMLTCNQCLNVDPIKYKKERIGRHQSTDQVKEGFVKGILCGLGLDNVIDWPGLHKTTFLRHPSDSIQTLIG